MFHVGSWKTFIRSVKAPSDSSVTTTSTEDLLSAQAQRLKPSRQDSGSATCQLPSTSAHSTSRIHACSPPPHTQTQMLRHMHTHTSTHSYTVLYNPLRISEERRFQNIRLRVGERFRSQISAHRSEDVSPIFSRGRGRCSGLIGLCSPQGRSGTDSNPTVRMFMD